MASLSDHYSGRKDGKKSSYKWRNSAISPWLIRCKSSSYGFSSGTIPVFASGTIVKILEILRVDFRTWNLLGFPVFYSQVGERSHWTMGTNHKFILIHDYRYFPLLHKFSLSNEEGNNNNKKENQIPKLSCHVSKSFSFYRYSLMQ